MGETAEYLKEVNRQLQAEVRKLSAEVELWKSRWEAADQALDATIKDYERILQG